MKQCRAFEPTDAGRAENEPSRLTNILCPRTDYTEFLQVVAFRGRAVKSIFPRMAPEGKEAPNHGNRGFDSRTRGKSLGLALLSTEDGYRQKLFHNLHLML